MYSNRRQKKYTQYTEPYSSVLLASFPNSRREKHTFIGSMAQMELARRLGGVYGKSAVSTGYGFGSMGTNSEPDVLLKLRPNPIAIELKSVQTFTYHSRKVYKNEQGEKYKRPQMRHVPRLGTSKCYIQSWRDMTAYATARLMHRMYVIEFRREGSHTEAGESGFMWMGEEEVDKVVQEALQRKPTAKVFHISLWDMMYRGNVMRFEKGEFKTWLDAIGAVVSDQRVLFDEGTRVE